jgi:hypothetical protein
MNENFKNAIKKSLTNMDHYIAFASDNDNFNKDLKKSEDYFIITDMGHGYETISCKEPATLMITDLYGNKVKRKDVYICSFKTMYFQAGKTYNNNDGIIVTTVKPT